MERQKRAWNMKKIVQMSAGLVLLLVCVCNVMFDLHAHALEGELAPRFQMKDETVRVGYFEQCSFIERENGKYSGYAVEYLEKIAKVKAKAPISVGDVLIEDLLGTGVQVVSTCNVQAEK